MIAENILLITSDQQHWFTLGVQNPEVKTPNLDRLARMGTLYNRAYTVNPTCTPTRASIITGQYPSQHGAWSLGTKLPEDVHTVGEDFARAGFKTALVGKAHFQQLKDDDEFPSIESFPHMRNLDWWRKFNGPFYGFDHIELGRNHTDGYEVGQHYALWMEEKGFTEWRQYFVEKPGGTSERQRHKWNIPEEYHYDAWIAERTNALMAEYAANGDRFFLWASFPDPHPTYLAPEPWDTMYNPDELSIPELVEGEHKLNPRHFQMTQEKSPDFSIYQELEGHYIHGSNSHRHKRKDLAKNIAVYYGMISLMDKYIGKILDKLDELGLTEKTLVVFTTDHGHFYGHHGLISKGPFHYEDMIRIPWLVSMPGTVQQGTESDAMQSIADLAPTFLQAAGLQIPRTMTGLDQWEVWQGNCDQVRDHVIVENHHQPTTLNHRTYINKRYKLTLYQKMDDGELFDLQEDSCEVRNLWHDPEYASLKTELLLKYTQAELAKEPLWMPRICDA